MPGGTLLSATVLFFGVPAASASDRPADCPGVLLAETGMDDVDELFKALSHGIHSLTLEDLRLYHISSDRF